VALWPPRSWGRSIKYYSKRILRLSGSPHAIAIGVACGVFASFTPLLGFHFLLGFFLAFILGGNMIAAALGTAFGNPFTFPLIWAGTHRIGSSILGIREPSEPAIEVAGNWAETSLDVLGPLIGPMLVGAVPLGLPTALVFYFIVLYSVSAFQRLRRERLAIRRASRAAARQERS
jgi:uncharacterized protein (DUF2062 family)